VTPLSTALGAEVTGIDLSVPLTEPAQQALIELFTDFLVLQFPDQDLTEAAHVELARRFGDPFIHPYLGAVDGYPEILHVLKEPDDDETFGGEFWHCDISFRDPPSSASLLYSIEVPSEGGDTLFANQYLALESLSSGMRTSLAEMGAHHVYPEKDESERGASAVHPVVRRHPISGRDALFVNPAFTTRFEGMRASESRPMLEFLHDRQTRPEFTVRIEWQARMLVMWDNRATLHYGVNDYRGQRRLLRRVTVMEPAG
jgi:taurine dioxygenase